MLLQNITYVLTSLWIIPFVLIYKLYKNNGIKYHEIGKLISNQKDLKLSWRLVLYSLVFFLVSDFLPLSIHLISVIIINLAIYNYYFKLKAYFKLMNQTHE